MDPKMCGRGFINPTFDDARDIGAVRDRLNRDGIAFLKNCGERELVELTRALGVPIQPRNVKKPGSCVSNIRNTPDVQGKGYTSAELFFHTDRSGWDVPPRILATSIEKPATGGGGASLFLDGRELVAHIRAHEPLLYELITTNTTTPATATTTMTASASPYHHHGRPHTSFKSEAGDFVPRAMVTIWQSESDSDSDSDSDFSDHSDDDGNSEDGSKAEGKGKDQGKGTSKGKGKREEGEKGEDKMLIRFRLDDAIRFSPALMPLLPRLKDLMCEMAFGANLGKGQGYILDNHRFLHARTAFQGDRELLRVLAHSYA